MPCTRWLCTEDKRSDQPKIRVLRSEMRSCTLHVHVPEGLARHHWLPSRLTDDMSLSSSMPLCCFQWNVCPDRGCWHCCGRLWSRVVGIFSALWTLKIASIGLPLHLPGPAFTAKCPAKLPRLSSLPPHWLRTDTDPVYTLSLKKAGTIQARYAPNLLARLPRALPPPRPLQCPLYGIILSLQ